MDRLEQMMKSMKRQKNIIFSTRLDKVIFKIR